jgi:hypothetical protein
MTKQDHPGRSLLGHHCLSPEGGGMLMTKQPAQGLASPPPPISFSLPSCFPMEAFPRSGRLTQEPWRAKTLMPADIGSHASG